MNVNTTDSPLVLLMYIIDVQVMYTTDNKRFSDFHIQKK